MKVAPTRKNQEMPRIDRKTSRRPAAWRRMAAVSEARFQLIFRPGASAGAAGIFRLASQPATATVTTAPATSIEPPSAAISSAPAMVPARIARKVPASSQAFPASSSPSERCCGRMPYLSGPKKVDCVPMRNSTAMRKGTWPRTRPATARPMIAISATLTARISRALSNLSATCPAVAENRK